MHAKPAATLNQVVLGEDDPKNGGSSATGGKLVTVEVAVVVSVETAVDVNVVAVFVIVDVAVIDCVVVRVEDTVLVPVEEAVVVPLVVAVELTLVDAVELMVEDAVDDSDVVAELVAVEDAVDVSVDVCVCDIVVDWLEEAVDDGVVDTVLDAVLVAVDDWEDVGEVVIDVVIEVVAVLGCVDVTVEDTLVEAVDEAEVVAVVDCDAEAVEDAVDVGDVEAELVSEDVAVVDWVDVAVDERDVVAVLDMVLVAVEDCEVTALENAWVKNGPLVATIEQYPGADSNNVPSGSASVVDYVGSGHLNFSWDLENIRPTLKATLGAYPGSSADVFPTGTVAVEDQPDGTIKLYYDIEAGLATHNHSAGLHIHEGTSCEIKSEVGGHYWRDSSGPNSISDPWTTRYTASNGAAKGSFVQLNAGFNFEDNKGHVVVVHSEAGGRLACGVLNVASGGIHIHTGSSCANAEGVGEHHWNKESGSIEDPWTTTYTAGAAPISSGTASVRTCQMFSEVKNRAVVVHSAADGSRIGCGVLEIDTSEPEPEEFRVSDDAWCPDGYKMASSKEECANALSIDLNDLQDCSRSAGDTWTQLGDIGPSPNCFLYYGTLPVDTNCWAGNDFDGGSDSLWDSTYAGCVIMPPTTSTLNVGGGGDAGSSDPAAAAVATNSTIAGTGNGDAGASGTGASTSAVIIAVVVVAVLSLVGISVYCWKGRGATDLAAAPAQLVVVNAGYVGPVVDEAGYQVPVQRQSNLYDAANVARVLAQGGGGASGGGGGDAISAEYAAVGQLLQPGSPGAPGRDYAPPSALQMEQKRLGGWGDGGAAASAHYLPYAKLLTAALKRMPRFEGRLFRGVRLAAA
eukprot:gene3790-5776_t